ncbi:hypothetical protein HanHA89_Chr11g0444061 [Helianthus annuus]|nr:hypothetical protein HanHA89_Chr11g0444061 [Helianthus annuus]
MNPLMMMWRSRLRLLISWKRGNKTKAGKPERKEKGVEEKATETPRKRPSTLLILDYIVVSDTLSGLGVEEKHRGSDPDDHATLTEIMRKRLLKIRNESLTSRLLLCLRLKRPGFRRKLLRPLLSLRVILGFLQRLMGTYWRKFLRLLVLEV